MKILKFDAKEVLVAVKHALEGKNHRMGYHTDMEPGPALFFVHDEGIYLMPNCDRTKEQIDEKFAICYAEGCDPREGDVWDHCRSLVGGDDFGETIQIDPHWITRLSNAELLVIRFKATSFNIEFRYSSKRKKKEAVHG